MKQESQLPICDVLVKWAACSDSDNLGFHLALLVTCYRDFGNKTGDGFV